MIVVFGSINADLVARVAHLPKAGETQQALAYEVLAGGKGANQALAARRAGADVALYGAVGNDSHAISALAGLAGAGVPLATIQRVDAPTGIAMIHVDDAGENTITIVAGANALASAAAVPDALLGPGATLVMQLEVPLPEIAALAARARQRGARTLLNAAPVQPLPAGLLASCDVLVVNEHEAAAVAAEHGLPAAPRDFARGAADRFGSTVVVTLGARGALAASGPDLHAAPAPAVTVIDTTGAGDAFIGAFAAALDGNQTLPEALARGVAAGALACTMPGAQGSLPDADAITIVARQVESALDSSLD